MSPEVAAAMAEGARTRFNADLGLSTTGVAGPTGGTPEKPVGLVYLGLATRRRHADAPDRYRIGSTARDHPAPGIQSSPQLGAAHASTGSGPFPKTSSAESGGSR